MLHLKKKMLLQTKYNLPVWLSSLERMYTTHQIAKYSSDPRQLHGEAILYVVCYLKKSHNWGLKFKPDSKKDLNATVMGFLRKLEQGICTCGSQYCQVTKRMDHLLHRMPHLLGLQTSISEAKYIKHYIMTSFLLWTCYRKWGSKTSRSFALSLMSTAKYLKTTQALLNSRGFQSYAQGPST